MNYLQIARETLSVESQALTQLSQRLDDEFSQVVDLILACEGRLVIGGIGKSGLIGKNGGDFCLYRNTKFLPSPDRSLSWRFRYVKTHRHCDADFL